MVRFRLLLSPTAEKDFVNLEAALKQRIVEKLKWFLENDVLPESLESNFEGFYKLRVGDYRIVYDLETDSVMRVRLIAHRSRVYKDLARLLRS